MDSSLFELNPAIRFVSRPFPMPARLRPLWAIGLLVMLVGNSRRTTSSRPRAQVLYWAVRSDANTRQLEDYLNGLIPKVELAVRYDPSFDMALELAASDHLVDWNGARITLTDKGKLMYERLAGPDVSLQRERARSVRLDRKLSETVVSQLLSDGGAR